MIHMQLMLHYYFYRIGLRENNGEYAITLLWVKNYSLQKTFSNGYKKITDVPWNG